jgi:hypothetical protein
MAGAFDRGPGNHGRIVCLFSIYHIRENSNNRLILLRRVRHSLHVRFAIQFFPQLQQAIKGL